MYNKYNRHSFIHQYFRTGLTFEHDWTEQQETHADSHKHRAWRKDVTSATTDNQRCKGASFPKLFQSAQNGNQNSCASFSRPEKKRRTERKRVEAAAAATDRNQTATFWCECWKRRILGQEGSRVDKVDARTVFQDFHLLCDITAFIWPMDLSLKLTHLYCFYGTHKYLTHGTKKKKKPWETPQYVAWLANMWNYGWTALRRAIFGE